MQLNKIRDLLYDLEDIDNQIEDLESYAGLVIDNDLSTTVEFNFHKKGAKKSNEETEELSFKGISFFFATSTEDQKQSNDEWTMVTSLSQSMLLKVFGVIMDDLSKKRSLTLRRLKKYGIDEGTANTIKKN